MHHYDQQSSMNDLSGILLCCKQSERFLPNAFIEAIRYRGTIEDSQRINNEKQNASDLHLPA